MEAAATQTILREEPARFTYEQFMELAHSPAIADLPGKLELVDGVIVRVDPARCPHARLMSQLICKLSTACEGHEDQIVLPSLTTRLSNHIARQPDSVVMRDPGNEDVPGTPEAIRLVAEVAHTTLANDLGPKRIDYAMAGIPHYWVVDVDGQKTVCFSQPVGGDYQACQEIPFGCSLVLPGLGEVILTD